MTQEEIIKHLHEALNSVDITFPYRYVLVEAIEALSQPSLPSNLDEAAEEYALDVKAKPYGNIVKEAFKDGATWRDSQIPELPSNLDEAAEKYAKGEGLENALGGWEDMFDAFKSGAEWMAGQGEEAEVGYWNQIGLSILMDKALERLGYEDGDKVRLQITKI